MAPRTKRKACLPPLQHHAMLLSSITIIVSFHAIVICAALHSYSVKSSLVPVPVPSRSILAFLLTIITVSEPAQSDSSKLASAGSTTWDSASAGSAILDWVSPISDSASAGSQAEGWAVYLAHAFAAHSASPSVVRATASCYAPVADSSP